MKWFERYYRQTAVYWAPGAPDGEGGRAFAVPVEMKVLWMDKEVLFTDALGEEKLSKAVVYPITAVAEKGYLYRGVEADLESDHSNPTLIDGAFEVKMTGKTPDLTGSYFQETAWL